VPIDLYQKQRDGNQSWHWDDQAPGAAFEATRTRAGSTEKVALLVSISGTIDVGSLPPRVDDQTTIYTIAPVEGTEASPDIFRARASVDAFAATYRTFLAALERDNPGLAAIELVVAAPLTAAIVLGRARMADVHPALRVYDRNGDGGYDLALEIT
jgi:hypothetical protein